MTIDEVLDAVFHRFATVSNAASLGTKDIQFQESYGVVVVSVTSVFIPFESPNDGVMISRTKTKTPPRSAQVEGGIAYTNIANLDNVGQPGGVSRLYMLHLNPPGGKKAAVVKVAGWIACFTIQGTQDVLKSHVLSEPKYDFDTPHGAIVFSGSQLDERFTKLKVINEATYEPKTVEFIFKLIEEDLNALPIYEL